MRKTLAIIALTFLLGCTTPTLPKNNYLIRIKWLGQTGFLIESNLTRLYINPYTAPIGSLKGDAIIISYSSADSCNPSIINQLSKDSTIIISTPECATRLSKNNIIKVQEGSDYFINDFTIRTLPTSRVNGVGLLIKAYNKTIYYVGVTQYTPELKGIKKADVLIFPIAGGELSMSQKDALKLIKEINATYYVPMYYQRESASTYEAGRKFKTSAKNEGINITLLNSEDLFIR